MDVATLTAERDTAIIRRDAVKSSLEICQTLSEQQQTRIHEMTGLLGEALRFMDSFEADNAGEIASLRKRMRACLGKPVTTQDAG